MSDLRNDARKDAAPDSWKSIPLPEQAAVIPFRHFYSALEMAQMRRGCVPVEMEDKWFLFMTGDTLFVHRSWTGYGLYRAEFTADGTGYATTEAMVNRDPAQYKGDDDAYDARLLAFLIDTLLLGKSLSFPLPPNLPSTVPADLYQHHVIGQGAAATAAEETEGPDKPR